MVRLLALPALAGVAALWVCPATRAETFELSGGGQIEGRLLNPGESPRESFVIQTPQGGKLTLGKSQVTKVITKTQAQQEYEELLSKITADAEAHWKLAEWCRKQDGMEKLRELHMAKVIEYDPEHEGARRGLGYSQIEGKWVRPEEHMESIGHVRVGGAWRTKQEAELEAAKKAASQAGKDWKAKIRMWTTWLGNERRAVEGAQNLKGIRDPLAAIALGDLLKEEEDRSLRRMYVEMLSRLSPGAGTGPLIDAALKDGDEQVRDQAMRTLGLWGPPTPTPVLVRALESKDRSMIHRAGQALAAVKDPEAVLPLIEALTTRHKQVIKPATGGTGAIGASFGSGGTGFSAGGSAAKVVERDFENPSVLEALISITGENFRYDKAAWLRWYGGKNAPKRMSLRRDE